MHRQICNQFDEEFNEFFGGNAHLNVGNAQLIANIKTVLDQERTCSHSANDIIKQIVDDQLINVCKLCGSEIEDVCDHADYMEEDGIRVCKLCGCEIEILDFEAEWRYYGPSDNRSVKDPSRCHRSKESNRGGLDKVFQDVKLGNLQQSIKKKVEQKYNKIVGTTTVRGKARRAIVAACLLFVYREQGDIRTSDQIRGSFELSKQEMSDGLTRYNRTFPEDRTNHVSVEDLLHKIMRMTGIDMRHYQIILRITRCLHNTDLTLKHSNPQSVASAIIYLYLCMKPEYKQSLGLNKSKFASKARLSDITISKLVKKAADVLGIKNVHI